MNVFEMKLISIKFSICCKLDLDKEVVLIHGNSKQETLAGKNPFFISLLTELFNIFSDLSQTFLSSIFKNYST